MQGQLKLNGRLSEAMLSTLPDSVGPYELEVGRNSDATGSEVDKLSFAQRSNN